MHHWLQPAAPRLLSIEGKRGDGAIEEYLDEASCFLTSEWEDTTKRDVEMINLSAMDGIAFFLFVLVKQETVAQAVVQTGVLYANETKGK